jgi:hypothetical protein
MTSLNLADNCIGGYYSREGFISTPEGTTHITSDMSHCHSYPCDIRSCCYRQCHQGYGGADVAKSFVE